MPAAVDRVRPFGSAEATIRSANTAAAASSHGEGSVRRARSRSTASTAVASSATSAGPTETVVPPAPKSTLGQVARAEQAQHDGDEEDRERAVPRRPPQRS